MLSTSPKMQTCDKTGKLNLRLLNVRTRQLEGHSGRKILGDTLLLHIWGEDEVFFNDNIGPMDKEKAKTRYRKIEYACKQTIPGDLNNV
jgi:hypothetical protein